MPIGGAMAQWPVGSKLGPVHCYNERVSITHPSWRTARCGACTVCPAHMNSRSVSRVGKYEGVTFRSQNKK